MSLESVTSPVAALISDVSRSISAVVSQFSFTNRTPLSRSNSTPCTAISASQPKPRTSLRRRSIVSKVHGQNNCDLSLRMKSLPINIKSATNEEDKEEPNAFSPTISPKRAQRGIKRSYSTMHEVSHQSNPSIHHRENKRLLVSGYIRIIMNKQSKQSKSHNQWPVDLNNVVLQWFDETTYWLIRGESMKEFQSLQNGQTMYGPKFCVGKLCSFDTTLCPNGWKSNQQGSCQFYIELNSISSDIVSNVTVYYELSCKDTGSHCKKIRTFRKKSDAQSWGTNNMRFTECQSLDSLEMATMVKVLRIEYTKSYQQKLNQKVEKPIFQPDRITIPRDMKYEWNIGSNLIDKFTSCQEGKFFYSPNFGGNCFCFEIAPNGWHITNAGQTMLYLRLLGLPQKVGSIRCVCTFNGELRGSLTSSDGAEHINSDNKGSRGSVDDSNDGITELPTGRVEHTFSYQKHGVQWNLSDVLSLETLQSLDTMRLAVNIRVIGVVDTKGRTIGQEEWTQYDIC